MLYCIIGLTMLNSMPVYLDIQEIIWSETEHYENVTTVLHRGEDHYYFVMESYDEIFQIIEEGCYD